MVGVGERKDMFYVQFDAPFSRPLRIVFVSDKEALALLRGSGWDAIPARAMLRRIMAAPWKEGARLRGAELKYKGDAVYPHSAGAASRLPFMV